jgi:subtilase family serine protease
MRAFTVSFCLINLSRCFCAVLAASVLFVNYGMVFWRSVVLLLTGSTAILMAQSTGRRAEPLIHDKVDENKLVTLSGNTRPEASAENDLGAVSDDLNLDHMMLQLHRSPEQEQAVEQFIDELHDPQSANFHKWLSANDFGEKFGAAEADIQAVTAWLESHGLTVNSVYPSGMVIDFSGNAGQVRRAFHTAIHNVEVNGARHITNFGDPQIPEALASAVAGVVSIHDFRPHKRSRPRYTFTFEGQPFQAVVPADLATIYDFNPLFAKGITGAGQTIAVIEDTNLYSTRDWTTFRAVLGLVQYTTGTLATVHPLPSSGFSNCSNPGVNQDDDEAILDAEWSSAAAPGAAIVVASCADTAVTSGIYIAPLNLVNESAPPAIISISYGTCEAENGATGNASLNALYQQAVAEGISIFVAAGDEGAASCDAGLTSATHGIGVSANASTPYNVAVGGTDYSDVFNGTTGKYWSQTNSPTYGSALSYIPEIPWNDSCAGSLVSTYMGYATGYGPNGFCNSSTAVEEGFLAVVAGSGGPSNCASGAPASLGVSNGTCQGFPKPSWQAGLAGIANDGVRDIPDVSMFASDGFIWGHYSVTCFSDQDNGGAPCTGAPLNWAGFGGTSVASPVMAGVQALVNQSQSGAQGNPNYVYYSLAAAPALGVFHSVQQGDIDVNCGAPYDCYGYLGTLDYGRNGRVFGTTWGGALSVSDSSLNPAYGTGATWNFANGLGSVDVNNLVTNWKASAAFRSLAIRHP